MKKTIWLFLCVTSCTAAPMRPDSLLGQQPALISIAPESRVEIPKNARFEIQFSEPVDPESLDEGALNFVQGQVKDDDIKSLSTYDAAIRKKTLQSIELNVNFEDGGRKVVFEPREVLSSHTDYGLILTSRITSVGRLPLRLGDDHPVVSVFRYQTSGEIDPEIGTAGSAIGSSDTDSTNTAGGGGNDEESEPEEPPAIVGKVVINEVYYDAIGSDTDGLLFVELFGPAGMLLNHYTIAFVDGSDGSVDDKIILPENAHIGGDGFYLVADAKTGSSTDTFVEGADLVDSFDPQNGPDSVQLLDPDGKLIDAVSYGQVTVTTGENGAPLFEGHSTLDVVNGHSIERAQPGGDTDDNAADFVDRSTPTPGF